MTLNRSLFRWFWYGYTAGFLSGLGDTLWSWGALSQYLPEGTGRVAAAMYVAGLYGIFGALVAIVVFLLCYGFLRWTRFEKIASGFFERHNQAQNRRLPDSLWPLAHFIVWACLCPLALLSAYTVGLHTLMSRNHKGLVVVVIIAATLGFLLIAGFLGFFLARLLEEILIRVVPRRFLSVLSRLPVAVGVGFAILVIFSSILIVNEWEIVAQLGPRPGFVILAYVGLLAGAARLGGVLVPRLRAVGSVVSAVLVVVGIIVTILLVLVLGREESVRKGSSAYTGLGGFLTEGLRRASDIDGDGFSSILGGGDCAPLNSAVHPGAVDIPGDNVDQGCIGGHGSPYPNAEDVGFVEVPGGLPKQANILFISIDAVRADHVSSYGYGRKTTPAIDGVAAKGVLFENAWAHAPSTRYSIPAMLTGRHPSQVLWNMAMWWPGLKSGNDTIAEILKGRGFTTGALLSYHYFHPKRLIGQGFDYYDNSLAHLHSGRNPASTAGSSAAELADASLEFIERQKNKRFFLWVHFYDPHYQYEKHTGTPEFGERPVDLYDHEILFTDSQIGRILAHLDENGLAKKTIVVITADHGTGFGEHGIKHHGYHLYGAQTRVPLIVYIPGMKPRRVKSPAAHVDILPTLANLAGAGPTSTMFGRSLLGSITGENPEDDDRVVFQEVIYEGPTERWAAVTRKWHLIYNMVPDNTFELYNLETDKGETVDVWGDTNMDAGVNALKKTLLAWINGAKFAPETYSKLATAVLKKHPAPKIEIGAEFENFVRLEGVDISKREVRPGEEIQLTWFFKSLRTMPRGWRVFVHMRGTGGFFLGDHAPVDGALPFESWTPGTWIADSQTIDVPRNAKPGVYEITAGLFRGRTRMEVAVDHSREAGKNGIRVGSIRVIP